jgi:mannose-6-phosphate isomerase-like protein (cupin superfamily)
MFHHRKLPDYSTLLSGPTPPDEVGFQSAHLQIWYNHTDASWVGEGERPHKHLHSDECFIVLRGSLVVEVDGRRVTIGPREFCCFPAGQYHAVVAVHPPVETLMIRAPSVNDKVYLEVEASPGQAPIRPATAADLPEL